MNFKQTFNTFLYRIPVFFYFLVFFSQTLTAQSNCGNLNVQVNITNVTTYLAYEGAYSVVLSGEVDTFTIVAETGELCEQDEFFCDLFGGEYCDLVHCEETFTVIVPDNTTEVTAVSFTGIPAGEYFFSITNNTGCSISQSAIITQPACNMTMDFTFTGTTSPFVDDGTIAISTEEATGNVWIKLFKQNEFFGYDLVDSLLNDGIFLNVARGYYLIDATDEVGCFRQDYVDIPGDFCEVSLSAQNIVPASLTGMNDASIEISGTSIYTPVTAGVAVLFGSVDYFTLPHTFTGLYGGDIIFQAYDSVGCFIVDTFNIPIPSCALLANVTATEATNNASNGSIAVSVSNGVSPYAILLYDDNNMELDSIVTPDAFQFFNLAPGNYHLLIEEIDEEGFFGIYYTGCDTIIEITVQNQTTAGDCQINASIQTTDEDAGYDATIQVTATGDNGDITVNLHYGTYVSDYPYDTFINNGIFSGLQGGFYTIEMVDSTGCRRHDRFFINYTGDFQLCGNADLTVINPGSENATDGSITVTVNNPDFYGMNLYDVTNNVYYDIVGAGTFSNLGIGNYYLTLYSYEGGNGSCGQQYIYLNADYCNGFSFNATATDETVFGLADGMIDITSSNTGDPATIRLFDPNNVQNYSEGPVADYRPEILTSQGTFEEITGSNYLVEFNYEGNCYENYDLFSVCGDYDTTYYQLIPPTPGNSDGSISVQPVPGSPFEYGYELYDDNYNYYGPFFGAHTFENLPASYYQLYVRTYNPLDVNHYYYICSKDIEIPLGVADCSNSTYEYSTTDVTAYNAGDGTVTITASGFNGDAYITLNGDCEGEIFTLEMDPEAFASIPTLDIKNGFTFGDQTKKTNNLSLETSPAFRTGENPGDTLINSGTFSNLIPGDYHFCINDLFGCESVQYFSIGSANCEVTSNISTVQPTANDNNGTITVDADILNSTEDAHIFIVLENYGVINDGFNTVSAFNLYEGTYYINIFGENGEFCYRYDTIVLDDGLNCDLSIEVTDFSNISAYGASDGTISVSSTSSFGDVTLNLAGQTLTNAGTFSGLPPGSYLVTGIDEAGCQATSNGTYFLSSPQCGLALNVGVDLPNPGQSNGQIHITTSGVSDTVFIIVQVPSITGFITIASGINQLDVVNLASFYYNITAYTNDYFYCNEGASIFLPESPCILNGFATGFDASAPFSNDGYIIAGANGGTGLYTFTGPGTQTEYNTFADLAPGIYTINITDITGCGASVEVSISAPGCFQLATFTEPVTEYGGSDGSVISYFSDGVAVGNVNYDLYKNGLFFANQVNNGNFSGLEAGNYSLYTEDEGGCSDAINFTITQPDCILTINTSITNSSIHGGADGVIDVTASGGLGTLSISLVSQFVSTNPGPQNSPAQFDSLEAGVYQFIVADEVSCADTLLLTITQPPCALTLILSADSVSLHRGNDGSITAEAGNGIAPYFYELYQGGLFLEAQQSAGAVMFGQLAAGNYTVFVSDEGGCSTSVEIAVEEPECNIMNYYPDNDGDGFGAGAVILACTQPDNTSLNNQDCDDNNAAIHPGTTEVCNEIDDDCNLMIDEDVPTVTYYLDADGDGKGNPLVAVDTCAQPAGYVTDNTDCDDNTVVACPRPTGTVTTNITDVSAMLSWTGTDCASRYRLEYRQKTTPASPWIVVYVTSTSYDLTGLMEGTTYQWRVGTICTPGGTTVPAGFTLQLTFKTKFRVYPDADHDGYGDSESGMVLVTKFPATGYSNDSTDCDDAVFTIHPDATELCNGVDDDCDMIVDDGVLNPDIWYQDADGDGLGNELVTLLACTQPMGYVSNSKDCDDNSNILFCAPPTNGMIEDLSATTATISWDIVPCALRYTMQYRKILPTGAWSTKVNVNDTTTMLTGLLPNTSYQFRVRSLCPSPNPSTSDWLTITFTTPQLPMGLTEVVLLPNLHVTDPVNADFVIYPNPGDGRFNISLVSEKEEQVSILVTDGVGKLIRQMSWNIYEGKNIDRLDLSDLSGGVYLVQIQQGDRRLSKKVVVVK